MREFVRVVFLVLLLAAVAAIVTPGILFEIRLSETWTSHNTDQLLGGMLTLCAGSFMIVGVLVGAGLFARLAGWRPRPTEQLPLPGTEVDLRPLPPKLPPWGVTGGGHYQLLPAPEQGRRYRMEIRDRK